MNPTGHIPGIIHCFYIIFKAAEQPNTVAVAPHQIGGGPAAGRYEQVPQQAPPVQNRSLNPFSSKSPLPQSQPQPQPQYEAPVNPPPYSKS